MTTRLLIGDAFDRMAQLDDRSFDLIVTSPPFLALRSYLPDGHPDKAKEIGSEQTPAEYLDVLLRLTAEWRRLLAPHGSLAVELGDTYAGSGGAGGDYDDDGLRAGQRKFRQNNRAQGYSGGKDGGRNTYDTKEPGLMYQTGGFGWPLDKSLTGIPTLYAWSLAYGRNLLTGTESPAGRWRIRNLKPWIRSNPPVGALGDKERSATSYITVACTSSQRWFDLDAVRTAPVSIHGDPDRRRGNRARQGGSGDVSALAANHLGGAPPLDWWHQVDAIIDTELNQRAGKANGYSTGPRRTGKKMDDARGGNWSTFEGDNSLEAMHATVGARGVHIRRALERAGILTTLDTYDISPRGYAGAHYAVWPPELVQRLISEMCPRRVCMTCGEPSKRIVGEAEYIQGPNFTGHGRRKPHHAGMPDDASKMTFGKDGSYVRQAPTLGWSDCGHNNWRPGRILDPFVGSGTTLAVASGMGRDSVGIDLDPRSADLATERVGMFLDIDHGTQETVA
jgi:DNA methylase